MADAENLDTLTAAAYRAAMLRSLRVKSLAIVENAVVEFNDGLSVLTGETGAGKSIIIGALGLVLGERADRSMIRAGEDKCTVDATFELADPSLVNAALDELGLEPCEEGRLIVRRIVNASGNGRNFINDAPATVQALKRIGDVLVDMHGPHDHQSLLLDDFQRDLLDAHGGHQDACRAYADAYRRWLDLRAALHELDGPDQGAGAQIDLLTYQINELEQAQLSPDDDEALEQEHIRVANAQRIIELGAAINNALNEQEGSAFDCLVAAQRALDELSAILTEARDWRQEAAAIAMQLQELATTVSGAVQDIDADPERLQWLEDRMALVQKLKRKYGGSVQSALEFLATARERLDGLSSRGERIAELRAELAAAEKDVLAAGRKLGAARRAAGARLGREVTREIKDLGFAHGSLTVTVSETAPGPHGTDSVEFGFAPNVGEPVRPLRLIASSGEISRVMLAMKAVLARHDRIPVLVFDEIDANVGGEMGHAIGSKLAAVAATHQVLCITHLPQVAAFGASHYVVAKDVKDGRTHTTIRPVTEEARVEEMARMLGGRNVTSVALQHARELLARTAQT